MLRMPEIQICRHNLVCIHTLYQILLLEAGLSDYVGCDMFSMLRHNYPDRHLHGKPLKNFV